MLARSLLIFGNRRHFKENSKKIARIVTKVVTNGAKWCILTSHQIEQIEKICSEGEDARMLIGSYEHTFDAKGRVFIPSKWRDSIGDMTVVTLGLLDSKNDRCIYGMSAPEWDTFSDKLSKLPITDLGGQAVRRSLYASAAACEVDKQGRILIPAQLRELAGLVKDVTLIGVGDRVEIWDPEAYLHYSTMKDEGYEEALAHLAQIGI